MRNVKIGDMFFLNTYEDNDFPINPNCLIIIEKQEIYNIDFFTCYYERKYNQDYTYISSNYRQSRNDLMLTDHWFSFSEYIDFIDNFLQKQFNITVNK